MIIFKSVGGLAQLARAPALQAGGQRFDSVILHHSKASERVLFIFVYKIINYPILIINDLIKIEQKRPTIWSFFCYSASTSLSSLFFNSTFNPSSSFTLFISSALISCSTSANTSKPFLFDSYLNVSLAR